MAKKTLSNPPTVLVVGFNVRPLARSAKKAGYRVLAVDYWGDLDLSEWSDKHIAILNQQPENRPDRPTIPTAELLVKGVDQILKDHGPVENIIVSGGFDDHPATWKSLSLLGNLAGNPSNILQRARNRTRTESLAKRIGATTPHSKEASNAKAFKMAVNRFELPIVVKPKHGSGGFHSRILRSESDISRYIVRQELSEKNPVLIQELIHGIDASVSILATGTKAIALSVNEQLIGLSDLGKGNTKAYCGNIVPLKAKTKIIDKLRRVSEEMAVELGIVGSNGFDFVVDKKGTPYFMEINPRIQATIEAIELVSNLNVVNLHLDACHGQLPNKPLKPRAFCARIIVYARFPCIIPNLSSIPGIVDIPMPKSRANQGDPVCTVNHLAASRKDALAGAWSIVNTIYQYLQPISSSNKEDLK